MSAWLQEKMGGATPAKPAEATTGPSVQDRAIAAKDQAGTFIGEQTQAVTKAAGDTAQYVQDRAADAVEYTKGPAAADKEAATGGNVFQQAGGQVMGAAVGARDAVMNTLGMGGDAAAEKK